MCINWIWHYINFNGWCAMKLNKKKIKPNRNEQLSFCSESSYLGIGSECDSQQFMEDEEFLYYNCLGRFFFVFGILTLIDHFGRATRHSFLLIRSLLNIWSWLYVYCILRYFLCFIHLFLYTVLSNQSEPGSNRYESVLRYSYLMPFSVKSRTAVWTGFTYLHWIQSAYSTQHADIKTILCEFNLYRILNNGQLYYRWNTTLTWI